MRFKTFVAAYLALIVGRTSSMAHTQTQAIDTRVRAVSPVRVGSFDHGVAARHSGSRNSATDYLLVRDSLEDYLRRHQETCSCKFRSLSDTLLTILFGAGGLIEPMLIAIFFQQCHNRTAPQGSQSGDRNEDINSQGIALQDMVGAAAQARGGPTEGLESARPDARPEEDEYPSVESTPPPYSLTDTALAY